MGLSKGLFVPIGVALTIIRVGLLLGLIFLRLVLTFLQGNQSQLTCQITRFYLICCGLFVIQTGDKSKEETICPINRQSGIDELLLSLSTPIKSIINRDQWKMSSILLRICNMSFGGLNATTPRFVIEGSNDFKNLPQRQTVQPVSIETNCFSPFQLQDSDSALISILKVISAPLTVYQIRFLNPKNLSEEENPADAVLETIKKSISHPNPSHLYRLPTPQPTRSTSQSMPNTVRLSAALLQQVDTVLEVFPQLSRDHVISDLVRSGDLNETIQNAMSGKIPTAEIKNKAGSKQKSNPVDPKIQDEVDKSIEDGSNPIKAWMNLDERRTALLHFARSKYLAKHAS